MKSSLYPSFKILLVDDEASFLRSLSFSLERYSGINNVQHCTDSRLAMDELATGQFGVVLLDLNMPYLSGEELLEKIVESHPHIAVIIISGIAQIERAVQCIKIGAYDYYVKTDEPERLTGGINRVVRFQELNLENPPVRAPKPYTFHEWFLLPNEDVYVMGYADSGLKASEVGSKNKDDFNLIFREREGHPFIISNVAERILVKKYGRYAIVSFAIGTASIITSFTSLVYLLEFLNSQ